jgi:hypothetical protein
MCVEDHGNNDQAFD